jgi:GMP synthase (glutamine-hydrolysing)
MTSALRNNYFMDSIAILDFGSQYAQIIARRVREAQVYCELFPWDASMEKMLAIQPKGFILSGGPMSVYEEGAPYIQKFIFDTGLPILGICYGMQALTHALGGQVDPSAQREYGSAEIEPTIPDTMLDAISKVWMSHGDRITKLPAGFIALARTGNSPLAAMGDMRRKYFGVQFHPEVHHTPNGEKLLKHFAVDICGTHRSRNARGVGDSLRLYLFISLGMIANVVDHHLPHLAVLDPFNDTANAGFTHVVLSQ